MMASNSQPVLNRFYTPENGNFYAANLYRTLDSNQNHFRLLEVHPSKDDGPIECTLVEPPKALELEYEALSYRAGDPADTMKIIVNGHSFNTFASLGAALRKLRLPERLRVIWADQICINQNDVIERDSQVQKMREIYQKAESVIAWLGIQNRGDLALCAMQGLHNEYTNSLLGFEQKLQIGHKVTPVDRGLLMKNIADRLLKQLIASDQDGGEESLAQYVALGELFRSEFWERLWIWQELTVAKTVQLEWDKLTVSLEEIYIPCRILSYLLEIECEQPWPNSMDFLTGHVSARGPSKMWKVLALRQRRADWQKDKFLDFKKLLDNAKVARCADPRDKVFSICGLINPAYNIVPKYNSTIQDIYCSTAIAIILQERSLDLLAYCDHPRNLDPSIALPSWCPNWLLARKIKNRRRALLWDTHLSKSSTFQASKLATGHLKIGAGEMQGCLYNHVSLTVEGLYIDIVQGIGNPPSREGVSNSASFNELLDTCAKIVAKYYPLSEEVYRDIEKTLTIDDRGYPNVSNPRNVIDSQNHKFLKLDAIEGNRRFFTTSKGLIGMAPPHVQVDDLVCVLIGARVPFILRKDKEHYTLVGEGYLGSGYMAGKAISEMEAGILEVQNFEIR